MKKFATVLVSLVVVVALIVLIALQATKGLPKAADAFFTQLAAGDVDDAYASTSEAFRKASSLEEFKLYVERMGIANNRGSSWSSRSIENNQGTLEGHVILAEGGTFPVSIDFVKEQDAWKIMTLRRVTAGVESLPELNRELSVPDAEGVRALVSAVMSTFAQAVREKDLAPFHASVSQYWQEQITLAEMRGIYGVFIDKDVELAPYLAAPIVFATTPALDAEGVLVAEGRFENTALNFRMTFIPEGDSWKLFGMAVNL